MSRQARPLSRDLEESGANGPRPGIAGPERRARPRVKPGRPPAPIRVLFVKDRLHETGGTLYYLQTLPRLDPARVTPLLCAFAPRHPIAARFEAAGIRPTFFGRAKWDPRCLMDLVRFARSSEADLLHLEGATSFAFGRLGARAAGLPAVLHFHCMIPLPWPQSILNRRLISRSWQGIAVSEAVRRWSIQACGIAPESVEVLYSGHDIDRFAAPSAAARDHVRREFAIDRRAPVVALVGRLDVAQKGQDAMIRAMAMLRARFPDAVLLLVGDGPDRERCAALVRLLGLDEAVRFAGHRHDVAEILAAVDVAVVPSLCEEAFGFVALEASAAGRPVVAFASGGLPEVVLHGQTGIVVPKGDLAGLADAIAHVLDDPGLARRLGEGGRRHASRFGLAQHADQLMDLYDAVLDEHHQSRGRTSHAWRKQRTC